AFGLVQHRLLPFQPKPGEVFKDNAFVFRLAARLIDVLNAKQNSSARALGHVMCRNRSEGVAEMQMAGWTWRKPRDNHAGHLTRIRANGAGYSNIDRSAAGARPRQRHASRGAVPRLWR